MGKKKRKQVLPWCYYCDREFESEKVLIDHQKAKHFKCPRCNKKLTALSAMTIHLETVHKESLVKVPNAIEGRDGRDIEVFGLSGIPEAALIAHEQKILYGDSGPGDENPAHAKKHQTMVSPPFSYTGPRPVPGMPGMPPPPGMPPMMPPPVGPSPPMNMMMPPYPIPGQMPMLSPPFGQPPPQMWPPPPYGMAPPPIVSPLPQPYHHPHHPSMVNPFAPPPPPMANPTNIAPTSNVPLIPVTHPSSTETHANGDQVAGKSEKEKETAKHSNGTSDDKLVDAKKEEEEAVAEKRVEKKAQVVAIHTTVMVYEGLDDQSIEEFRLSLPKYSLPAAS